VVQVYWKIGVAGATRVKRVDLITTENTGIDIFLTNNLCHSLSSKRRQWLQAGLWIRSQNLSDIGAIAGA